jgi:succinate dehydrogenase / fumarate reductase cytochrome b subunit
MHRMAGVGIFIFLMAHIVDTSLVGWGSKLYNEAVHLYTNPIARFGEIVLVGAVLFHAINGVRVIIIDFAPRATQVQRQLFYIAVVIFLLMFIPAGYFLARGMFG